MSGIEDLRIRELSDELAKLPDVRLAWLFGSRARGEPRPDSDVDVAVLVDDQAMATAEARHETRWRLGGRLGRVVGSHRLDLVLLNDAPPLLRQRVLRDGRLLFERSPEERVRFVRRTIREVQDGQVRRDWFLRHRIDSLQSAPDLLPSSPRNRHRGRPSDLLAKARSAARLLREARRLP